MIPLETIVTGAGYAALAASPAQLAICRAAEGRPLDGVISSAECRGLFGTEELPPVRPTLVCGVAGVRGGKSMLAACAAIAGSFSADLRVLRPHEVPRFSIVAPLVDNATATYEHLVGVVRGSKILAPMLVAEPTGDALVLRRPDGRRVEVAVVAASRGAVTLRSRWSCGFVLDEAAAFGAESVGYAVTAEDILRAGEPRLLQGAQGWIISSPMGPSGLLFDLWREHFGKPGRVLVWHAPTRVLFPGYPQEKIDALRAREPDTAAREHDAAWIDAESAFLDAAKIDACTRARPLVLRPVEGVTYVAGTDPATRGNSWTLVVAHPEYHGARLARVVVDVALQWTGSKSSPLSPRAVLKEIAGAIAPFRVRVLRTDQWSNDALRDLARDHELELVEVHRDSEDRLRVWRMLRTLIEDGSIELPPEATLRQDLVGLRRRATNAGISVHLPQTANGRHCDYAPALALAIEAATRLQAATRPRGRVRIIGDDPEQPGPRDAAPEPGEEPKPDNFTSPGQRRAYERARRGLSSTHVRPWRR